MIEITRVGDVLKNFRITPDKETKPKKIIFELSECKTYYNCQMYCDVVVDNEIREAIIVLKTKEPTYAYDFRVMPDDDEKQTMFTITIPDDTEDWFRRYDYGY